MSTVVVVLLVIVFCIVGFQCLKKYVKYVHKAYHSGKSTIWFKGFDVYNRPVSQRHPRFTKQLNRGDIVVRDFRNNSNSNNSNGKSILRVATLNMEMGKHINRIISSLQALNADIICLQEVDVSTKRAHSVDIVAELGTALNMNTVFAVEVAGDASNALLPSTGYEGNAILTKFDIVDAKSVVVQCARYQAYTHKHKLHNEAMAIVRVPNFGLLACVSAHLDPHWCGVGGRVRQYDEIVGKVMQYRDQFEHLIVCGDLNTVCHGLNRLYPSIGCDNESRFERIGCTEAHYFDVNAVQSTNRKYNIDLHDPFDKAKDYTMRALSGAYTTKADWCLLSGAFHVVQKQVCPFRQRCSDHQWLMVDVKLCTK